MKKIGIIGAGAMGKGIAKNLQKAGYEVVAHKRNIDEANDVIKYLRANNVAITSDLQSIFKSVDILLTCLPDSPTVENVLVGKEGLVNCEGRSVKSVIDFSTAHPDSTKEVAKKLEELQIEMLDTPMTGGPYQADEGTIRLVVGGNKEVFDKYKPLLEKVATKIVYAGDTGCGNAVKLMNNFLAILGQAATAGVSLLMDKMGISREAVHEYISASGGNSWGFNAMMKRIMEDNFENTFALNLAFKDLRYNKSLFDEVGGFPILDSLVETYKKADETGFGDQDVGAIYFSIKETLK